jgi:hypothetical protein
VDDGPTTPQTALETNRIEAMGFSESVDQDAEHGKEICRKHNDPGET